MLQNVFAICAGASAGAIARWGLAIFFNLLHPYIPLGTLAANLIGGYCVGLAASFFAFNPHLALEWRLLVITGFLGALTTFSAFSLEAVTLIQEGRLLWALGHMALHIVGSLLLTFLGMGTYSLVRSFA